MAASYSTAADVTRRTAVSAFWIFGAFAVSRFLGFGVNLILARLLSPAEFGLVGFAMVMIGAFTLLQDLGVSHAIVYYGDRGGSIKTVGGTALCLNVATALLLFVVAYLLSPVVAAMGGNEQIAPILQVLAFGLVVLSLGSVQSAMLMKESAFRRKLLPDVVPIVVSGVVSIVLALLGYGAWSLVIGYVARTVVSTVLLWCLSQVRPWPSFEWAMARKLLGYGQHLSLSSLLGFATFNIDYFLVGKFLGAHELGIYTMAFVLANLPVTALSQVVGVASFPVYAKIRDNTDEFQKSFSTIFSMVSLIIVPVSAVIYLCAPSFTPFVLGERWTAVAVPVQILSLFGALRAMEYNFTPVYRALGRPDLVWRLNALKLVLLAPVLYLAAQWSVIYVAVGQVVVAALTMPVGAMAVARLVGLPRWRLARLAATPFAGAAVMAVVVVLGEWLVATLAGTGTGRSMWAAASVAVVAVMAYGAVVYVVDPRAVALAKAGTRKARAKLAPRPARAGAAAAPATA